MQRLARVNLDQQNASAVELFGHYDEITTILLRHLPPSTATMLARPEVHGDVVEWYSELQGQPYLLGNSEREQQARKQAEGLILGSAMILPVCAYGLYAQRRRCTAVGVVASECSPPSPSHRPPTQ